MFSIKIKLTECSEFNLLSSRFLGVPSIPEKWIDDISFDENDVFLCQINLDDLSKFKTPFTYKGILYFFINLKTEKPKVLYSLNEKLIKVNFNDEL